MVDIFFRFLKLFFILYPKPESNRHSHYWELDFLTTITFVTFRLWSGLYLHHIFQLRCSVSSLYTFLIFKAWLGIGILKLSQTLRNSTPFISKRALIFYFKSRPKYFICFFYNLNDNVKIRNLFVAPKYYYKVVA